MNIETDVIVVGGGPCGSFTALNLAKYDLNVSVFEEHNEIGVPCHCTGHLSITSLKNLGLYALKKKLVENTFIGATFHSPKGNDFSVRFSSPVTCVVNRVLLDKYIAKRAIRNGSKFHLNSKITSLIVKNGFVKGVIARTRTGTKKKFFAKIVVDAEGASSTILRQTNLPATPPHTVVNGVQAEVENVKNIELDMVEIFLGKEYAPGFYAWLVPKSDGKAKIGLAVKNGNPKKSLLRFMSKHPIASKKLGKAKILHTVFHPIPLGGSIMKTQSNGFLAVGDAASQVKPITGGGIFFGLVCSKIAAEVVNEAFSRNIFSVQILEKYQKRCNDIIGFDTNVMLKMRKTLDALSDKKIDDILKLCTGLRLEGALRNIKDLDFYGKSLLRLLSDPRVLVIFFHFFTGVVNHSLKSVHINK